MDKLAQITFRPGDDGNEYIQLLAKKYPDLKKPQDVLAKALYDAAMGIVIHPDENNNLPIIFHPNEKESEAIEIILGRVGGLQNDAIRAIGWALDEHKDERDKGGGRKETGEKTLALLKVVAKMLGVKDDDIPT